MNIPVELNKYVIYDNLTKDATKRTSLENIEDVLLAIQQRYGTLFSIDQRVSTVHRCSWPEL